VQNVALFVPCYVDQLRPSVGLAALELLEARGCAVAFPREQTCCGQPFLSAGAAPDAARLAERFVRVFAGYDAVVAPSGSCVAMLRRHLEHLAPSEAARARAPRGVELCEFLVAQEAQSAPAAADPATANATPPAAVPALPARTFPHRVALHASCHALRELRLGTPSETREPARPDPARVLLSRVAGLELVPLTRADECCGFGGVFAVEEEAVSCRMARDRLADHLAALAELVTSTDVSCLIHLEGVARRRGLPIRALHVSEILAGRTSEAAP
jgi:L-lactate dehydrogenase complex protein LldE